VSALIGPVLVIAGFAFYMITNVFLGRFRRLPWEFIALSTLGALVSVAYAVATPSPSTVAGALVGGALLAFLYWFFFSFSMYGPREDRPCVGDVFPAFRLPASDGSLYESIAGNGGRRLLIFYRGSW
jgi:hypothetical protein